jgi:hypothetical protein
MYYLREEKCQDILSPYYSYLKYHHQSKEFLFFIVYCFCLAQKIISLTQNLIEFLNKTADQLIQTTCFDSFLKQSIKAHNTLINKNLQQICV